MMVNNEMPHLEFLLLSHANPIPASVFNALGKMPNLSQYSLLGCAFNSCSMKKCLELCEERSKTGNSLSKLELAEACQGINHGIINAASSIRSLTWLDLHYYEEIQDSAKVLLENVAKPPLLQHIKLSHMEMSLADLLVLRTCSSLRYVELDKNYELAPVDIKMSAFPSNVKVVYRQTTYPRTIS